MPRCNKCSSVNFNPIKVSHDFLRKLKNKPGIGRPRRYSITHQASDSSEEADEKRNYKDNTITVEKLFQLSRDQLSVLFNAKTKDKIKNMRSSYVIKEAGSNVDDIKREKRDQVVRNSEEGTESRVWLTKTNRQLAKKESSVTSLHSKRPLNCPHDPCRKIIAISSFLSHFKHEHPDIPRYSMERGKELHLLVDPGIIEHNSTVCLGLVTVYDINRLQVVAKPPADSVIKKFSKKIPIDTFWIMVSGSPFERKQNAYVLYWLFTNNDDFYNCILEVSSNKDVLVYSTFCGVNDIQDSQDIIEVAQRLNCLYLPYGCVESMLRYGSKLNLRITIH